MRKKRIIVLSICGIMSAGLVSAFLFPFRARSMGMSFSLLHHHSAACLGEVVKRQESDPPGRTGIRYEDVCPQCGGVVHHYEFIAHCNCGESWYREGHACFNSPYGSNPEGGCSNYSPVDFNTMHDHLSVENVCGRDEETVVGEVTVDLSTTDPAREVTLTVTYRGELAEPVFSWEEPDEPETEEEESEEADTEDETIALPKEDETSDPEDAKTDEETVEDEEEAAEESPSKLGSSITVVRNGIYTLLTEYEEDGIGYTLSKSVTIGNIDREGPEISDVYLSTEEKTTEPVRIIVEADDENGLDAEAYSIDGIHFFEDNVFSVKENGEYTVTVRDSLGNTSVKTITVSNIIKPAPPAKPAPEESKPEEIMEEPPAEEPAAEVLPTTQEEPVVEEPAEEDHPTKVSPATLVKEPEEEPKEPEPEPVPDEPKPEKGGILSWYRNLPTPVKVATTVSAGALIGGFLIWYAWMILFRTAKVMWTDESGKAHYLTRVFIRRKSPGFTLRLTKNALLRAENDAFCILLPGLFAALYRYQPVAILLENQMYSLHVEKEIRIHNPG